MKALLHAELIKLRTTRTFGAVVGSAALLSLLLVGLGAGLGVEKDPHALFTNNSITYVIVLLGAMLICALLGIIIERLAYKPVRKWYTGGGSCNPGGCSGGGSGSPDVSGSMMFGSR